MVNIVEVNSPAECKVKSVTVYKAGKAEVVRVYQLNLMNGDNEIRISGLSSCIDNQSVRVTGLCSGVRLVDIVCTTETSDPFRPNEILRSLLAKKQKLEAEKRIRQEENEVYASYAKSLVSQHVSTQELVPFMQTLVQERRCVLDALASLDEQIHAVAEAIAEHGANKSPAGRVMIHVFVDRTVLAEPPSLNQSSRHPEPDEEWKKCLRNDIDAEFAPDIAMLMTEKARKLSIAGSAGVDYERIEREYDSHLLQYMTLANHKYEERLAAERRRSSAMHDHTGTTTLTLSYVVTNASWKPLYDVHTTSQDTEDSLPITMHYRASITQKTGEDWADAPLVLSAASDIAVPSRIPCLPIYRIQARGVVGTSTAPNLTSGQPATSSQPSSSLFSSAPRTQAFGAAAAHQSHDKSMDVGTSGSLFGSRPVQSAFETPGHRITQPVMFGQSTAVATTESYLATDIPPNRPSLAELYAEPQHAMEHTSMTNTSLEDESTTAILRTSPIPVSYAVSHSVQLPSDGTAHTVSVASLQLNADVYRVCVPRLDAAVYLQAKVINNSGYRLLAGPVNVYLDDSFVARTAITNVMPNETFECTLGTDLACNITYERLPAAEQQLSSNRHATMFAAAKRITKHVVRTYVTNNHSFSIKDLVVRDTLPITTLDDVKVILKKPEGLTEARGSEEIVNGGKVKVRWSAKAENRSESIEGKYEWLVSLDGGKGCTLETEWEVQTPPQLSWKESC